MSRLVNPQLLLLPPLANLRGVVVEVQCGDTLAFVVPLCQALGVELVHLLRAPPVVLLVGSPLWALHLKGHGKRARRRLKTRFPNV